MRNKGNKRMPFKSLLIFNSLKKKVSEKNTHHKFPAFNFIFCIQCADLTKSTSGICLYHFISIIIMLFSSFTSVLKLLISTRQMCSMHIKILTQYLTKYLFTKSRILYTFVVHIFLSPRAILEIKTLISVFAPSGSVIEVTVRLLH